MTKIIEWAGDLSTDFPKLIVGPMSRTAIGSDRGEEVFIPGKPGSWYFEEEPGNKRIAFDCHVLTDDLTTLDTDLLAVATWYERRGIYPLRLGITPGKYYDARIDSQVDTQEWRGLASFELAWVVGPYALDDTPTVENIVVLVSPTTDSFIIADSIPAYPVIELTANGGTITAFFLTINGDVLNYVGPTVSSGGTVTISTISETVTSGVNTDTMLTGAYNPANVTMSGVAGRFPTLLNGSNDWNLAWSGTATSVDMDITWRRRYL